MLAGFAPKVRKFTYRSTLLLIAALFLLLSAQGFLQGIVSAHSGTGARHGDFDVLARLPGGSAVPGVTVNAWHSAQTCDTKIDTLTNHDGVASFRDCGVSSDGCKNDPGCSAKWNVRVSNTPPGFTLKDVDTKQINVVWKQKKEITFNYERVHQDTFQVNPNQPSTPASQSNGRIKVTWYEWKSGGNLARIGGGTVGVAATGFGMTDTAHNCNPYLSTVIAPGADQVTFPNCWPGGTSAGKEYHLENIGVPVGYNLSSIRMAGNNERIDNKFRVYPGQETSIAIWLEKIAAPPGSSTGNSGGSSAVSTWVPVVPPTATNPYGKPPPPPNVDPRVYYLTAPIQTVLTGDGISTALQTRDVVLGRESIGAPPVVDDDDGSNAAVAANKPPSTPEKVTLEEVGPGAIKVNWSASTDDSGEPPTYTVERAGTDGSWEEVDALIEGTEISDVIEDDEGNKIYEGEYTYRVIAEDGDGDTSDYSSPAPIKTGKFKPVVPADSQGEEGNGEPTNLATSDQTTGVTIPDNAVNEALDCSVATGAIGDSGQSGNIGEIQGSTQNLVCREEDGDLVENFDEDVEYSLDMENSLVSEDTELYGFDGEDWVEIETDDEEYLEDDGTTLEYTSAKRVKGDKTTFKVKSKKPMILAIIDRHNPSPVVKIAIATTLLAVLGGVGFMTYVTIMRRRIQARALHPYEDIDIAPLHPRVDYTPTLTAPEPEINKDRPKDEL